MNPNRYSGIRIDYGEQKNRHTGYGPSARTLAHTASDLAVAMRLR